MEGYYVWEPDCEILVTNPRLFGMEVAKCISLMQYRFRDCQPHGSRDTGIACRYDPGE